MKKFQEFEEEIYKCSKCGLCQSVCPVYKVTGNDCAVSRGKFIMLNGVLKKDLKLDKTVNKYLDMCLKCNACKDFCPSGIDAKQIFECAKCNYFANDKNSVFTKIFQSELFFGNLLNCIKVATTIYRFLKFDVLCEKFYPFFQNFGFWGRKAILANEFVKHASPLSVNVEYEKS